MKVDPFKEYLIEPKSTKKELEYSWYTAIGLQKVDGLETSDYLKSVAKDNINGKITIEEAEELIKAYYIEKSDVDSVTEEVDTSAVNIAKVLEDKSFVFSPTQFLDLHKKIFHNVFTHAGQIRTYNISKKEWVLDGDTVCYCGASLLKETLEFDFEVEKKFDYSKISKEDFIPHIAKFIADIWQIHVFAEGNTRTTAVFLIKYLRKFGYKLANNIFFKNAWYFRNALVRANYSNIEKGVFETTKYLEDFLNNAISNTNKEFKNRHLHIRWNDNIDIQTDGSDIDNLDLSLSLKRKVSSLVSQLSSYEFFGREEVSKILNVSPSGASKLISKLLSLEILKPVSGHGKGKYCFNIGIK